MQVLCWERSSPWSCRDGAGAGQTYTSRWFRDRSLTMNSPNSGFPVLQECGVVGCEATQLMDAMISERRQPVLHGCDAACSIHCEVHAHRAGVASRLHASVSHSPTWLACAHDPCLSHVTMSDLED